MGLREHECEVVTYDYYKRTYQWDNTNKLTNKYFIASKTGITPAAGPCLVSALRIGPYECKGCLIDCKSPEVRWKEMATILIWSFDHYLKQNKIGAYNPAMVQEFKTRREKEQMLRME